MHMHMLQLRKRAATRQGSWLCYFHTDIYILFFSFCVLLNTLSCRYDYNACCHPNCKLFPSSDFDLQNDSKKSIH